MKTIGASQFKEKCLAILEELTPEGLVITKHGRPVATVLPIPSSPRDLIGSMKGKIKINGDISSTGQRWDAES